MLNRLPETSSSENQHQSFWCSGSCREWAVEENQLALTERAVAARAARFHLSSPLDLCMLPLFLLAFIQHILLGSLAVPFIF